MKEKRKRKGVGATLLSILLSLGMTTGACTKPLEEKIEDTLPPITFTDTPMPTPTDTPIPTPEPTATPEPPTMSPEEIMYDEYRKSLLERMQEQGRTLTLSGDMDKLVSGVKVNGDYVTIITSDGKQVTGHLGSLVLGDLNLKELIIEDDGYLMNLKEFGWEETYEKYKNLSPIEITLKGPVKVTDTLKMVDHDEDVIYFQYGEDGKVFPFNIPEIIISDTVNNKEPKFLDVRGCKNVWLNGFCLSREMFEFLNKLKGAENVILSNILEPDGEKNDIGNVTLKNNNIKRLIVDTNISKEAKCEITVEDCKNLEVLSIGLDYRMNQTDFAEQVPSLKYFGFGEDVTGKARQVEFIEDNIERFIESLKVMTPSDDFVHYAARDNLVKGENILPALKGLGIEILDVSSLALSNPELLSEICASMPKLSEIKGCEYLNFELVDGFLMALAKNRGIKTPFSDASECLNRNINQIVSKTTNPEMTEEEKVYSICKYLIGEYNKNKQYYDSPYYPEPDGSYFGIYDKDVYFFALYDYIANLPYTNPELLRKIFARAGIEANLNSSRNKFVS